MTDSWKDKLSCATECHRCNQKLGPQDPRILSVFDHEPICMPCKRKEEKQPDYEQVMNVCGFHERILSPRCRDAYTTHSPARRLRATLSR